MSIFFTKYGCHCGPHLAADYYHCATNNEEILQALMSVGMKEHQKDLVGLSIPHIHPVAFGRHNNQFCIEKKLAPYVELYCSSGTNYAGLSLSEFLWKVVK